MRAGYDKGKGKEFDMGATVIEMGRTRIEVKCPFCAERFDVFVWSLAGSGKKCPDCGAMHLNSGYAYPVETTPK